MSRNDPPSSLSTYVSSYLPQVLEQENIPAAAIVAIKNGEIVLQSAAGFRDLEHRVPADPQTVFAIGSTSKAFTAALLGQLVDEGRVRWDDLVVEHIPEFRTKDPAAWTQLTLRDIQCHRTGIPRHDIAWFFSRFSRQELLEKIRFLEPFAPLRSAYWYNNFMWMVAGIVVERMTGKTWEENVRERLFKPLGMKDANCSTDETQLGSNYALPYDLIDGKLIQIPFHQIDAVGPAGSINAHIEDYTRWLLMNIQRGMADRTCILSETSWEEIMAPQMAIDRNNQLVEPIVRHSEFSNLVYTLGWVAQHYRGRQMLQHAGGIDGFSAFIAFLPDEKTGVGVLTNLNGTHVHYGIAWDLIDRLMGWEPLPWVERMSAYDREAREKQKATGQMLEMIRVKDTQPSHPLQAYAGTYTHPAYGQLSVEAGDGLLKGVYNHIPATFQHYHYDFYLMHLEVKSPQVTIPVHFHTGLQGDICKVTIPWEEKTGEIEYLRQ